MIRRLLGAAMVALMFTAVGCNEEEQNTTGAEQQQEQESTPESGQQ